IQKWKPDSDTRGFGGARHLQQIVVADGELHVQGAETVPLPARADSPQMLLEDLPGGPRLDGSQEVSIEQLAAVLSEEELVGVEAARIGQARPTNVTLGAAGGGRTPVGQGSQDALGGHRE